jgi:hypothetical protein
MQQLYVWCCCCCHCCRKKSRCQSDVTKATEATQQVHVDACPVRALPPSGCQIGEGLQVATQPLQRQMPCTPSAMHQLLRT